MEKLVLGRKATDPEPSPEFIEGESEGSPGCRRKVARIFYYERKSGAMKMKMFKREGINLFIFILISSFLLSQGVPAWAEEYDQAKLFEAFDSQSLVQGENLQGETGTFNYQDRTLCYWQDKMPDWMPDWVKKSASQVIYICDQAANTILGVVALAGQSLVKSPILVYGMGSENVIIDFVNRLLFKDSAEMIVMETEPNTIPDDFIVKVQEETGVGTVREEPVDEYIYEYSLETKDYPEVLVVADQEEFMPYASLYASRNEGVFVNTIAEAERMAQNDQDVEQIVYFGDNPQTAEKLKGLAPQQEEPTSPSFPSWAEQWLNSSDPKETFTQISSISEAEQSLVPATWGTPFSLSPRAVTAISADNSEYWWIAPIYAYLRDTALISVATKGKTVKEVDEALDFELDQNILPFSYNRDPDYLVISEPWKVIPYRYYKEDYMKGRYVAADTIYADRDGDLVQDMAVGRFTAYDIPTAVILMNRGYFFDKGKMERGDKAFILQPWEKDFVMWIGDEYFEPDFYSRLGVEPVQNDLIKMYGEGNVYGKIGFQPTDEYTEPSESWPSLGAAIALLRESEMNYIAGHANPFNIEATNPYFHGAIIREYGPYPPSLWYFSDCNSGVSYQDFVAEHPEAKKEVGETDTLIHGALTGGAVNIVAAAGLTPYLKYADWPEWTTKYLAQGESIGRAIMKGQKLAAKNVCKVELYNYLNEEGMNPICKQVYLIGDPMVKYGSKRSPFSYSEADLDTAVFYGKGDIGQIKGAGVISDNSADFGTKLKIDPAVKNRLITTFGKTFKAEVSTRMNTSTLPKAHPVEFKQAFKLPEVSKKLEVASKGIGSYSMETINTQIKKTAQFNKIQPNSSKQLATTSKSSKSFNDFSSQPIKSSTTSFKSFSKPSVSSGSFKSFSNSSSSTTSFCSFSSSSWR